MCLTLAMNERDGLLKKIFGGWELFVHFLNSIVVLFAQRKQFLKGTALLFREQTVTG